MRQADARTARLLLVIALVVAWLSLSLLAVPPLISRVYGSELFEPVNRLLGIRKELPLAKYQQGWRELSLWAPFWISALLGFAWLLRDPRHQQRNVGSATASELGFIRIVVSAVLLISACWEDVASSAQLPRELLRPMGVVTPLSTTGLGLSLLESETALLVLQWVLRGTLLLCLLGYRTRLVLPVGALLYLIVAGILRQYAWFYHTGLLPLYLLFILSLTPAGDGLSIDRWLRNRRGAPPASGREGIYAWSRYACWTALSLAYLEAGLSKLRNGGLEWFAPNNLKSILLRDSLNTMHFDWQLSLRLVEAPPFVFSALAVIAVGSEVGYGLVLFSRYARLVIPIVAALLHVSIVFLQNVLFFDLILLQLIFYRPSTLKAFTSEKVARSSPSATFLLATPRAPAPESGPIEGIPRQDLQFRKIRHRESLYRSLTAAIAFVMGLAWLGQVEFFPFTAMQMYSRPRLSGEISYHRFIAHLESGRTVSARPEECIGAVADGRYKRILHAAFSSTSRHIADDFFSRCARRLRSADPVHAFEVQEWKWDFERDSRNRQHGHLARRYIYRPREM